MARSPCADLSHRMGLEGFHRSFHASRRFGAMLRVRQPGRIRPGAAVTVEERPDHGVTVAELAGRPAPESARRLLESGVALAPSVRARARRVLARAPAGH